jgi:penicillin-binding protein 1C
LAFYYYDLYHPLPKLPFTYHESSYVKFTDIRPQFLEILLSFEDRRFFSHAGVDLWALMRASTQWFTHQRVISGGSTITMQIARLLEPKPRTLHNKMKEMLRAFQLESRFSKAQLLEIYLNLAPYGGPITGLKKASLRYFNKAPQQLSISESALLVALPQSPTRLRPTRYLERATQARNKVLRRAIQMGTLSEKEGLKAIQENLELQVTSQKNTP